MGIVRKQALANTIFSYLGIVLGYVNLVLLFPSFFSSEEFGLFQLIIGVSAVYSQLAPMGLISIINRFFPIYKSDNKEHNGFLALVTVIGIGGFTISTIIYLILKNVIIGSYAENSGMFNNYYYIIIPFSFLLMLFNIFEALNRSIFFTKFSTFLREVAIRLFTTVGILFYIFKLINFEHFIFYYIIVNGILAILMFIQIIYSGEYKLKINLRLIKWDKLKEVTKYGGFTLLSGAALFVGQRIDILMIGSMLGLSIVGAYSLFFYIATVIYVPMRALSKISYPIIATAWKDNDQKQISDIYNRTSLIQFIIGGLIYIGIIINKHNLFYFIKKPEYIDNFGIFYFVGIAILIDVIVGLNSEIISSSPKYKFDTVFNLILLVVSVISNIIFIKLWGGVGAAIAAMISFFTFNFLKWLFLFRNYNFQPLNYRQTLVIIIGTLCYFVGVYIPLMPNVFIDIIVRSSVVTLVYVTLVLSLKISSDLNERFDVYKGIALNAIKKQNN